MPPGVAAIEAPPAAGIAVRIRTWLFRNAHLAVLEPIRPRIIPILVTVVPTVPPGAPGAGAAPGGSGGNGIGPGTAGGGTGGPAAGGGAGVDHGHVQFHGQETATTAS